MELEHSRMANQAMTYDEVSMERSKSFVKSLQELKNLRPQLYSAAEYCEKSYLHSEQKQITEDPKFPSKTSGVFQLLDNAESTRMRSSAAQIHVPNGGPSSIRAMQAFGVTHRDASEGSKPLTAFRSFDQNCREIAQVPARSKSVLSAFFAKPKAPKLKASYVS